MTKKQIAKELKILAQLMKNLGTSIEFYSKGEHDTRRSTNYQTACPNCQHEFTVDFEL